MTSVYLNSSKTPQRWLVSKEQHGIALVDFLSLKLPAKSAKQIRRQLDSRCCFVDDQPVWVASRRLSSSQQVCWVESLLQQTATPPSSVVYEDDFLLVIDKAEGVCSELPSLMVSIGRKPLHSTKLVHRLDKYTSGLLMLAKDPKTADLLEQMFRSRQIEKVYLALVEGRSQGEEGVVSLPLLRKETRQGDVMMRVVRGKNGMGMSAVTCWKTLKRSQKATLLLCRPQSGRTHQIRVHLASQGLPIVGDQLYGARLDCSIGSNRHYLHAWQLSFIHPHTGRLIELRTEPPKDFLAMQKRLIPRRR